MPYQNKARNLFADRERKRRYREERKAILVEYKGGCCMDCRQVYPLCVYEFDHLYNKEFEIGTAILHKPMDALKREADKCDLVCANCHRIRTKERAIAFANLDPAGQAPFRSGPRKFKEAV